MSRRSRFQKTRAMIGRSAASAGLLLDDRGERDQLVEGHAALAGPLEDVGRPDLSRNRWTIRARISSTRMPLVTW